MKFSAFGLIIILLASMTTYQVFAQNSIVIAEFESNPAGSDNGNEWIKLYNPTNSVIDISGWMIKSTHGKTNTYIIPGKTLLNPTSEYIVKLPGQFLDNKDESVILKNANGIEVDKTGLFSDASNDDKTWKKENYLEKKPSESMKTVPSKQSPCKGIAKCIIGTVTKVYDGDTLWVKETSTGKPYKIRLSLTSTLELNTTEGVEASNFLKQICLVDSGVIVDQDDKQLKSYDRILGKVTCADKNINEELLSSLHATISKKFCKKSEFATEDWAKKYGC